MSTGRRQGPTFKKGNKAIKITLDPNLERALLRAVAEGTCPTTVVKKDELSKKGQAVHTALVHLFKRGAKAPIAPASILLAAHNLTGFPKASADAYLRSFKEFQTGEEIVQILETAREKAALVSIINEAGDQLSSGRLDTSSIARAVASTRTTTTSDFAALSKRVTDKFPTPPRGLSIHSLPDITKASNGLAGIWILGGEPGLGKSTLALQIAVDVAGSSPCIYYDIDGTGEAYFIERLGQIFDHSVSKFKRATERFYYRSSIHALEGDLTHVKPPAILIVDSIQTLPDVAARGGKESTDDWLRKFKDLIGRGYTILGVSEKPRSHYGAAEMGGYKGSGAIEYAGTICAHLIADEDDENLLRFVVVKNRHGPLKGHVANLIRDDDKVFWFNEERVKTFTDRKHKKGGR